MSELSEIGVNDDHKRLVLEYLHFTRFRRTQCVRAIDSAFQDLAESRLVEGTFTCDEVREMLSGLSGVVRADVESELITTAHTNAALLRELFIQAEKWMLKLNVDIGKLEDRDLLETIARLEQRELSASSKQSLAPSHRLEPLNTAGGDKLLHMEINRLKEENKKLQEKAHALEAKATSALSEKDRLKSDLAATTTVTEVAPAPAEPGVGTDEVIALQGTVAKLQLELAQAQTSGNPGVKEELTRTTHELLRKSAELEKTKEELEKKFVDTVQYANMKRMIASKNEQIKELRAQQLKQKES